MLMLEFSMPTRGQIRADLDDVMRQQEELNLLNLVTEVQKRTLQDLETQEQQLRAMLDVFDNDKPFTL